MIAGGLLGDLSISAMRVMRAEGYATAVLDLARLGVGDESVGTVICSEVLEHIPDDRQALVELTRVLRPDGWLIVTVPLHQRLWRHDDDLVGHYRRYDPEQLTIDLREVGLCVDSTMAMGSPLERYLTLASVKMFMGLFQPSLERRPRLLPCFGPINAFLARLLQAAALVTPSRWNSLLLLQCRKV
jgi:SAM-dependent methyltransferase